MTLENNTAPLLYYVKLCALFQSSHGLIQTGVTFQKRSIRVKIGDFYFRLTLKFVRWPCKKGYLICTNPAFCIISKQWVNSNFNFSRETLNSGKNRRLFVPCDPEIWWMTLKINRAPLLCCFKLYASFRSQWWIQTGVTVLKRPIWSKSMICFTKPCHLQFSVQWHHNEQDGVSNHQPHGCLLNRFSGADQRTHQSSASLAFVRGIHRDRWIPRTKGQLRGNVSIWWHHHGTGDLVKQ